MQVQLVTSVGPFKYGEKQYLLLEGQVGTATLHPGGEIVVEFTFDGTRIRYPAAANQLRLYR